jgi:hypothetical protein
MIKRESAGAKISRAEAEVILLLKYRSTEKYKKSDELPDYVDEDDE